MVDACLKNSATDLGLEQGLGLASLELEAHIQYGLANTRSDHDLIPRSSQEEAEERQDRLVPACNPELSVQAVANTAVSRIATSEDGKSIFMSQNVFDLLD